MLTIQHRAGEDGKLYGSVTTKEIAEAIAEARGLRVDRKKIRLDDPIREIGTYMVEIEVGGGATARIKTIVAEAEVARPATRNDRTSSQPGQLVPGNRGIAAGAEPAPVICSRPVRGGAHPRPMGFSPTGKANGAPGRPGGVDGEQMAQTQTHVPPQNLEAEASVLGAMMVSEGAIAPVILDVRLHDEDFYRERHRIVFRAIKGLYEQQRAGRRAHRRPST